VQIGLDERTPDRLTILRLVASSVSAQSKKYLLIYVTASQAKTFIQGGFPYS
jgi:hypothetical protein